MTSLHSQTTRRITIGACTLLLAVIAGFQMIGPRLTAQSSNPIPAENQLPGNPKSEWDVTGSGDSTIQGFATDISVNKGNTISFKVTTTASSFSINIYRLGYYQGNGARKVATISGVAGKNQAACLTDTASGLYDCGNWTVSTSWNVPTTAVSGIYIARLVRTDNGGTSHIPFVVRDDAAQADILLQTDDTTWEAYNQYGGHSLYLGSPTRGYKVSYNRPFATRGQSSGYGPSNYLFYAEYPMVRWLESNGFNVKYQTGVDTDRYGSALTGTAKPKTLLTVGHDEYWSGGQRNAVEAARTAGVNLAFFTGNETFWKTRYESSIDGTATPYRTLVAYKETHENKVFDPADPPTWTGTWRDPRFSPPADGGRPENALTGQIFTVNRGTVPINVPGTYAPLRFWRNTAIAALAPNQSLSLAIDTLGYEWDEDLDNGARPAGSIQMSSTVVSVPERVMDFGSTYMPATATHHLSLYRHSSGALVFGAGTVQWVWGLDTNHDVDSDFGSATPDPNMRQATLNLLADMGVQPATIQSGLIPATTSTDLTPPTSTITAPAVGSSIAAGTIVTISGTATDAGGGVAGGVEVSTDGGATWRRATGTASWSYTWVPGVLGNASLLSRATDDSGNLEQPSTSVPITITQAICPCSIWTPSLTVPWMTDSNDGSAVELGLKFQTDVGGIVNGVRFYKASTNTGTHTGHLWSSSGTLLASVTFTGESASGWQQANFSSQVIIQPSTTYVISYFAPKGHYSDDEYYLGRAGVDQWPLHALKSGADGPNGIFFYGASSFPNQTWFSDNYSVDVVFTPDLTPPTVAMTAPANGASISGNAVTVSATASDNLGIAGVQFKIDGVNLSAEKTASPYSISWNSTLTSNGTHAMTAVARDLAGNLTTSAPITVSVFNVDTVPPTVSISSPLNTATVRGVVSVTAAASDNQGVAGVQFLVDGASYGAEVTSAPYTITWDTTGLTNNSTHTLAARVRDTSNNVTTSASNTVTISNPVAGAPAIDALVWTDQTVGQTSVSSPVFATSFSNELLLAFVATDYLAGANTTVTGVTGGGLTWALVGRTNVQAGSSEIWRAFAPSPLSNVTVSATLSQAVVSSLVVASFSNVDTSGTNGSGAIGATASANSTAGAPTATLTTTRNNSWVFGVGNDYDNAIARSPGANQAIVHQYLTPAGDTYWMQRMLVPTAASPTSVTINDTAPTGDRYNLFICEIRSPASTDTTPPTVSMTAPANGATVSGSVAVSATASDNVGVASVQFKLDGANLGSPVTTSPYAITWNAATASGGTHSLTAVASDAAGNAATATPISVTVNNPDVTPPTATITAPANGATVSGTAVTVSATASDNIGVVGVQFKLDGANLGAEVTTAPYQISWNTTTTSNGSHSLSAVARDAAGNLGASASITVTVTGSTSATQPTALTVFHRNGQSFITWKETTSLFTDSTTYSSFNSTVSANASLRYRIYRSTSPITSSNISQATRVADVPVGSGYNNLLYGFQTDGAPDTLVRRFVITEDGNDEDGNFGGWRPSGVGEIPLNTGLDVYTVQPGDSGNYYYAVTGVNSGVENVTDFSSANALQSPVAEQYNSAWKPIVQNNPSTSTYSLDTLSGRQYIMTRWEADPLSNRNSAPNNYMVVVLPGATQPYKLDLGLHCWGSSLVGCQTFMNYPDGLFVTTTDYPPQDWWTGFNSQLDAVNGPDCSTTPSPCTGTNRYYTMHRLDAFINWMNSRWLLDQNRRMCSGVSMGGSGGKMYCLREGDLFNYVNSWVGLGDPQGAPIYLNEFESVFGLPSQGISSENGINTWDDLNMATWLRANPTKRTPFISFANGKNDPNIPWQQAVTFYQALRDTKRPYSFQWGQDGHAQRADDMSTTGLTQDAGTTRIDFQKNKAVPAFANFSLDNNPGNGATTSGDAAGAINLYQRWDPNTIIDQPSHFEIDLWLVPGAPSTGVTDVTPRYTAAFTAQPTQAFAWQLQEGSTVVQQGSGTADALGLVTVPAITIKTSPVRRLFIDIAGAADTTPPTVSMTAPAAGATVSGTAVAVSASASDNVGVTSVQFQLDGTNLGSPVTTSPYSIVWNSTTTSNGSHVLTAVASDAAGNTTTASAITVTVANDTTPPTVSMTVPAGGSTVSGSSVTVSATATDNVAVAGVQFKLDGANLGAEVTTSPYSISWDTTTTTNGSHSLTAVARDSSNNTATATAVTVTVSNNDTTPPTVSMTAPASGATVSGTTVTVSATASDNVGVKSVQFTLDGANLGAAITTNPYTMTWNSTTASNGSHALAAVASDAAGNTATATPVTVTVSNDTTPPTVSITAPANGSTVSGTAVIVSASASDNVAVAGVQFKLDGVNLAAEVTTSPYSISWNTTTTTNGSHSLTAVARDSSGNTATAAAITVTVSNTDTTAPTVVSTTPASGATGVSTATAVTATFSEPINAATLTTSTFVLRDPSNAIVSATVSYNATTLVATLTPSQPLSLASTYTATITGGSGGVKDLAGNALVSNYVWSFTTPSSISIWGPSATPSAIATSDASAVELGVKFRSDISGNVTGVRFYKGATNTGTHTGTLWSSTGTKLATATFSGETASGWQQVTFSKPVAITANTVYVVSYHTTVGNYGYDSAYFAAAGVDNAPLHALANGVSGGNGVYIYGRSAFPTQTFNATNYWVDVVFSK